MLRMNNSFLLRVALKWAPDGKRKRGQWRKTEWRLVTALGYRHSWWRLTDCLGEVKSVAPSLFGEVELMIMNVITIVEFLADIKL